MALSELRADELVSLKNYCYKQKPHAHFSKAEELQKILQISFKYKSAGLEDLRNYSEDKINESKKNIKGCLA